MSENHPPERRAHVRVRADDCVGSGICAASCPEVFVMDGDRATTVSPRTVLTRAVRMAAMTCPVEAIEVTDVSQPRPGIPSKEDPSGG